MELSDFCEELSEALKEKGHEGVLYKIEGDKAELVSNRSNYDITRREENSKTEFTISCIAGDISDFYDHVDASEVYDSRSFAPKDGRIVLGINNKDETDNT